MSRSGVQLEVLRLFRGFMKEVKRKSPESREQFRQVVYARFYQDAKIPKYVTDFVHNCPMYRPTHSLCTISTVVTGRQTLNTQIAQ